MTRSLATPSRIHFPPFSLDLVEGRLTRNGEPMRVRPKTFDVLRHLATRPGELVTKDDLLAAAWADVAVTEDVVRISIRAVQPAHAAWAVPVDVYFRRSNAGWTLVGVERIKSTTP